MTTTESTIAELDDQLTRLDAALTTLTAQREGIEVGLRTDRAEWSEHAVLGDVDGDLTNRVKGYEGSLGAVDEALRLNRARHAQVTAQRGELVTAQQLATDRERCRADMAVFAQRDSAQEIVDRCLETMYAALRSTVADLRDLHAEHERLSSARAGLGITEPLPDKTSLPWSVDLLGRVPTQVWRAATQFGGWPADKQACDAVTEYLRVRLLAAERGNPNEPVPSWPLGG